MKMINRFSNFNLLGLILIELVTGNKKKKRVAAKHSA